MMERWEYVFGRDLHLAKSLNSKPLESHSSDLPTFQPERYSFYG
jgi:hypothetical protein